MHANFCSDMMHLFTTIIGPGIEEEEWEVFCEYGNRVAMNDAEFGTLRDSINRVMPFNSYYLCTIRNSNTNRGKAKMVITSNH